MVLSDDEEYAEEEEDEEEGEESAQTKTRRSCAVLHKTSSFGVSES